MVVILADDVMGRPVRAARCDGVHESPVLASARVVVNGIALDCCEQCLAYTQRLAAGLRVVVRVEPVIGTDAS
jgi:hypothetical protein